MDMVKKQLAAVVATSLLASQGSWAGGESPNETLMSEAQSGLLADAFGSPPSPGIQVLDEPVMRDTQGELWPWIIGVATLDLSLASFFGVITFQPWRRQAGFVSIAISGRNLDKPLAGTV